MTELRRYDLLDDGLRPHPEGAWVQYADYEFQTKRYQRAVWFLQDIAAMSRKVGSETAAHGLAQLGEPRSRDGD